MMMRRKPMDVTKKAISLFLLSLLSLNTAVLPVSASAGPVSFINNPLATSGVPLVPVSDDVEIEIVPYDETELPEEGIVLSGQSGQSPVSDLCSGGEMTEGSYVCSTFSTQENMSEAGDGHTFSKNCKINVIGATYPKFFHGGDINDDGRIDIYDGEWPSFSDVTGQLQPSTTFENGEMYAGTDYHDSGCTNYPPGMCPTPESDGSERTEANYYPDVLSGGDVTESPGGDGTGTMAFPSEGCDESPFDSVASECASARKAYVNEWTQWSTSDVLGAESGGGSSPVSSYGPVLFTPSSENELARPDAEESVCPSIDLVSPDLACINWWGIVSGWGASIVGFFQDIGCRIRGDCLTNVQIMINTDSLTGTNSGGAEPNGDMVLDTYNSVRNIPQQEGSINRTCSNYGTGQNAPCWQDRYVGTPGACTVCGRLVDCTFVWKNWLYDNYTRQRSEEGPCEETDVRTIAGRTYNMCHFDTEDGEYGYFEYVKVVSSFF